MSSNNAKPSSIATPQIKTPTPHQHSHNNPPSAESSTALNDPMSMTSPLPSFLSDTVPSVTTQD
jgi:hypothetical protein